MGLEQNETTTFERESILKRERPVQYEQARAASDELWKVWNPDASESTLPAMFHENYDAICNQLFEARGLVSHPYEDRIENGGTGYRGLEFFSDVDKSKLRGYVVITMGWRAPEWLAADLIKVLNQQGYHVMVTGLPGYGINYEGPDVNTDIDTFERFGQFHGNYRKEVNGRTEKNPPLVQMPMSLSARGVFEYMANDQYPDIGDGIYAVEPALWLKPGNDFLINTILKRYRGDNGKNLLRERIFYQLESATGSKMGYPYQNPAAILQKCARILGESAAIPLGHAMNEFYVRPGSPEENIQELLERDMIIGATSGLNDEMCDVLRTLTALGNKQKIILGAPHSLESDRRPYSEVSWLMENIEMVLEPLNEYVESLLRGSEAV